MYKDIFFTQEYQDLFTSTEFGGIPCQFTSAGIDYRFYKRPIEGTNYFDIVSPYGYSGAVSVEPENSTAWKVFLYEFNLYCKSQNIIAEFARTHPFIENYKPIGNWELIEITTYGNPDREFIPSYLPCIQKDRDIYYVDLTQSLDDIWKGFDKGCKSAIKKAEKYNSDMYIGDIPQGWINHYNSLMRQKGSGLYAFDNVFFDKLNSICEYREYNQSGIILLKYGDYCHYFLSAGNNDGSTNLLLWESMKWAKAQGCKIFNLGGGLKAGDSLESFKRSFTHTCKPFFTYRKCHNPEAYNAICEAKGIDPKESYFPAYRSPKCLKQ